MQTCSGLQHRKNHKPDVRRKAVTPSPLSVRPCTDLPTILNPVRNIRSCPQHPRATAPSPTPNLICELRGNDPSLSFTTQALKSRLNQRVDRRCFLNIHLAPAKAGGMQIMPQTSGKRANEDKTGIRLYGNQVPPQESVKSLEVRNIDRLSFRAHTAAPTANTPRSSSYLGRITKRREPVRAQDTTWH